MKTVDFSGGIAYIYIKCVDIQYTILYFIIFHFSCFDVCVTNVHVNHDVYYVCLIHVYIDVLSI